MTINTTDVDPPAIAIDPQARAVGPVMATSAPILVPEPAEPSDLEASVNARREELIAELVEMKADARLEAVELRDRLKAKLVELAHIVKEGVVDGWANINETTKGKLDRWLAS